MYRAMEADTTLEFINRSKGNGSLFRDDTHTDLAKMLKDENYQVAIVMFGANDAQAAKKDGTWHKVGSEAWREVYGKRVEDFIKQLRAAKIATYWVGLPIMRSPGQTADAEMLNEVYREKAFINGAKFVDVWNGFADESGRFSPYGPDLDGQARRMRADDGVHFTMRGYVKLAHFVEKEMRKDLNAAKQERNVPLAGSEEEQAKLSGGGSARGTQAPAAAAPASPAAPSASPAAPAGFIGAASGQGESQPTPAPPMQEIQVGDISVVRPAISDSSLKAAAQSAASSGAGMQDAETITNAIPGGLTAVATLSVTTDVSLTSSRPRLPLSQRPYYRVLIKGEQLKAKTGRADDYAWPPG
jgi:lysophospholipase L1-like esterase